MIELIVKLLFISGESAIKRRVTAISFITPNSAPPDGTARQVAGTVTMTQPGYNGMHIRKKVKQLCTGLF